MANPRTKLKPAKPTNPVPKARTKGARYTPVSKRQDRPDAIAWLLKNYPELSDGQISKLLGTTKNTINAIREREHWNMPNIKPQNPVAMGLCSNEEFERVIKVARRRAENAAKRAAKEEKQRQEALAAGETLSEPAANLGEDTQAEPSPTAFSTSTDAPEPSADSDGGAQTT